MENYIIQMEIIAMFLNMPYIYVIFWHYETMLIIRYFYEIGEAYKQLQWLIIITK
jgi:hypothetical protein